MGNSFLNYFWKEILHLIHRINEFHLSNRNLSGTTDSSSKHQPHLVNHNSNNNNHHHQTETSQSTTTAEADVCVTPNCSCLMHHSNQYGGGVINSDGTIYINEIKYVQNYLQSFLYIEELQKFKEDENYRDSLELEPDAPPSTPGGGGGGTAQLLANQLSSPLAHSPNKHSQTVTTTNSAYNNNLHGSTNVNNGGMLLQQSHYHRKTHSLFANSSSPALVAETKDLINEYKLRHHPLDDSLVESNGVR